jgi:hypothetical protein
MFQKRKSDFQQNGVGMDREDESMTRLESRDIKKPEERTTGLKPGWLLSKAEKGITEGIKKTFEVKDTARDEIMKRMPSFKSSQDVAKDSEMTNNPKENDYRDKWPPKFRTNDGHKVRSKGERSIDNWFYSKQIVHEYEKDVVNSKGVWIRPDFYLPYDGKGEFLGNLPGGIYVEFWGVEEKEDYTDRMKQKQEFYKNEKFRLVNINPSDIVDISNSLPKIFKEYFKDKV